jgi:hypothetical protein
MAIIQAMCNSFKKEALQGLHNFDVVGGDTFKLALYTNAADLSAATTVYTASGEVAASGSYVAGGGALVNGGVTYTGTTAFVNFEDLSFTGTTITAFGALIYNFSKGNRAVAVLNFGANKTSISSTFTVRFPPDNATSAIIRFD